MYIDEEKVASFLKGVSAGMENNSNPEQNLALGILLLSLIFLFVLLRTLRTLRTRRERQEQVERDGRLYARVLTERMLAPSDIALLRELIRHLPDPQTQRYELSNRRDVLERTARAFLAENGTQRALEIEHLKIRLGLHERREGQTIRTSAEIPPQTILSLPGGQAVLRVVRVLPAVIHSTRLTPASTNLPTGTALRLSFVRLNGIYTLETTALRAEADLVELQHSVVLRRESRRRVYRNAAVLPARLGNLYCETRDVGGGVCLNLTRGAPLRPGTDHVLELLVPMTTGTDRRVRTSVRVVEVRPPIAEGDATFVHARFTRIREADRDRIYQYLFNRPEPVPEAQRPPPEKG